MAKNRKNGKQVKYHIGYGLAVMPNRDLNIFRDMSNKGWHVCGTSGILYRFEHGEPHDYDYALNFEDTVDAEMLSLYEAGGWTPIIVVSGVVGYQIFRAEVGTPHIFSDVDSEIEVLRKNCRFYGKWSLIFLVPLVVAFISALSVFNEPAFIVLWILFGIFGMCFSTFFTSFVGHSVTIAKKKRQTAGEI
jgi:hypothetical protein